MWIGEKSNTEKNAKIFQRWQIKNEKVDFDGPRQETGDFYDLSPDFALAFRKNVQIELIKLKLVETILIPKIPKVIVTDISQHENGENKNFCRFSYKMVDLPKSNEKRLKGKFLYFSVIFVIIIF